jgi:hypothetical protein
MARAGTVLSGSFVGKVTPTIWTEIHDVLIPQMMTYNEGTAVRVPVGADKWEGHILSGNHEHLRIDLQGLTEPRSTTGVTWDAGSAANRLDANPIRYANWQVQFGPHGKTRLSFSAKRTLTGAELQNHKGSIAGIHMALANDFSVAEIQRAFTLSYTASGRNGNTFGVLLPTGPYTEPVVEVEKRWIVDLKCKRECKARKRKAFKMNFGKKEGKYDDKATVVLLLRNALGQVPCPVCEAKYALELEGTDAVTDQAAVGKATWAYNFNIDSYTLTERPS